MIRSQSIHGNSHFAPPKSSVAVWRPRSLADMRIHHLDFSLHAYPTLDFKKESKAFGGSSFILDELERTE